MSTFWGAYQLISFQFKFITVNNLKREKIFLLGSFLGMLISLLFVDIQDLFRLELAFFGIFVGFLIYLNQIFTIKGLKNLSSSMMFINVRVFSSIFLLFLGIIFFNEQMTLNKFLGFFLGVLVFALLFDKNETIEKEANVKVGLLFLCLSVLTFTIANFINKYASLINPNVLLFYFLVGVFVFSLIEALYKKSLFIKEEYNSKIFILAASYGTLISILNHLFFTALSLHDLAVVYKIFSFEIFVPIFLSAIFYNEKLTIRKIIAFILTIASIWFFL